MATVSPDSKKLIRFDKIELQPSETKNLIFTINAKDLSSVGIQNKWITEDGDFEIQVGGNPQQLLKKMFYYKK